MKNKVSFRIIEFSPGDRDGTINLIDTLLKELRVIPNVEEKIDDEDLFNILKVYSGRGNFWVAKINNEVIGTVAIREIDKDVAKLNRMFVLSGYHGGGLGQALFDVAIDFVRENGYSKVILNTHLLMHRAHKFYKKNGFKFVRQDQDKFHYEMEL